MKCSSLKGLDSHLSVIKKSETTESNENMQVFQAQKECRTYTTRQDRIDLP